VNGGGRGFGNQKASRGNGTVCSHAGALFKVSPDGKKFEVVARGFRAPNGIGVRADGQVTTSDNEGTWVPTTPLNWVDGKAFHGVINDLTPKDLATKFSPPILWLSHNDYDNSGGGQIWVTSDKWGPFKGELLHESYGKSSLYLVMRQDIGKGRQGDHSEIGAVDAQKFKKLPHHGNLSAFINLPYFVSLLPVSAVPTSASAT
jgi:hypothetical protein